MNLTISYDRICKLGIIFDLSASAFIKCKRNLYKMIRTPLRTVFVQKVYMKYINEASFLSLTQHGHEDVILRELYSLLNVSSNIGCFDQGITQR